MARPAVFLDRDGTLLEDYGYLGDPAKAVLFPETIPALRRLADRFLLFIVTNQSGVAKGLLTPEDVRRVNDRIRGLLADAGIVIQETYSCPHQRSDACACRKPNPHFGRLAQSAFDLDLAGSFVVGDHPSDVEFAANLGARGVYVLTGHGRKHREELALPCPVVAGIAEAADAILSAS
jgi:histidinol-phosphate phosphatase family protein